MNKIATLFLLSVCLNPLSALAENFKLDLLHTNDLHSHFIPYKNDGSICTYDTCLGGFARIKSFIDTERKKNPNLLLLDAGDRFSGTVFYTLRKSKDIAPLMNPMKYDAINLGNHDFDGGLSELEKFALEINAPILSSNVIFPEGHSLNKTIIPAIVIHKNGKQIGVISALSLDTKKESAKADEIKLKNPIDTIRPMIEKLKSQGVNIIILLNHIGIDEDIKLAQELTDVDIIISAHTHTLLSNNPLEKEAKGSYPLVIKNKEDKNVLIVSSGIGGHHVGKLSADFNENGEVISFEGDTIQMNNTIKPDKALDDMILNIQEELKKELNQKLFSTEEKIPLTHDGLFCSESCYIGEVLSNALLLAAQKVNKEVDFAFLNAGSIRSGLPKGDITFEHIAQTYPFDSKAVITKMTGQEIMEYLNYGLKTYIPNDRTNPLLQTAGIGYLFSGKTKNIVKTNIKLENEKEYLVVMPSFLANGGDGFKKVNIIQELPEKTIREAFISILATTKMNSFENRIKKMIEK